MTRVNRRNYYRILHVQPDAPGAVIRMAYRTLMQKLRMHPDLGGDGATATLINEAYATLSDPARRAQYDTQLPQRAKRDALALANPNAQPAAKAPQSRPPVPRHAIPQCPFCKAQAPPPTTNGDVLRCASCASPLSLPPPARRLTATRRAFERHAVDGAVEYFLHGAAGPQPAALRDFSPHGALLIATRAVPRDAVLAIKTPLFDALARVVHCEPAHELSRDWRLRLEFLTLALTAPSGSLVSTRA